MPQNTRRSIEERRTLGKSLRKQAPRTGHAAWSPGSARPDPIRLLEGQNKERLDFLVPVRRGRTLALSHARSGDPVAIAAYLGSSDTFDQALVEFSQRYADQNQRDYEAFQQQVQSGRLEAVTESS